MEKESKIKIRFPDGSEEEFKKGVTGLEIAKTIGPNLAKEAVAVKIDGELKDLNSPIEDDSKINIITFKDKEGLEVFRHSSAHVLAQAVLALRPFAKLTIGPVVEEGFYYDIDTEPFTPDDLRLIEKEMDKIVKDDLKIERKEISKAEALKIFKENSYKTEMINELPDETVSIYKQGNFTDLCKGPHVTNTGKIKAFKLLKVAGAYWRADISNKQLQRIYGISFPERIMLDDYLKMIVEAEKRDHRKLGKELDLFSMNENAPGFPFFHPKGMVIWNELQEFWRKEHRKAGYQEIKTPIVLNKQLWLQSGHWDHYKENMYFTKIDNVDFALKPMNCPGAILLYKTRVHSYRELPLRYAEMGLVHRHELSGVLAGLFRVRAFTQDDAHIFVEEEQLEDEIKKVIDLVDFFYKTFDFEYHVELSTKPEQAMGDTDLWYKAEKALEAALNSKKVNYKLNPGEGAFYGPKIDFHIKDCLGRTWQCATIQVDFQMPERFDITYEGKDGRQHRPVIIHRTLYGAIERFFGIVIEHYSGKFPLWLAPTQIILLPIADRHVEYCKKLGELLDKEELRYEIDERVESVPKKVRDAQAQKIPIMLTVGDKELENETVAVRTIDGKVKFGMKINDLVKEIKKNIENKEQNFSV